METANKCRIYPNKRQIEIINNTFGCARFVYNHFINEFKEFGLFNNFYTWHHDLVELKNKKENLFLKKVDKFATELALKQAVCSISRYKSKLGKEPKFKSKRNEFASFTTKYTNNNIEIKENYIKLPKLGWIKMRGCRNFNLPILGATISRISTKKYYVSVTYKNFVPKEIKKNAF